MGEVPSPTGGGDPAGQTWPHRRCLAGLHVYLRRVPGPEGQHRRAVGLPPGQPDLAPGQPGRGGGLPRSPPPHCAGAPGRHVGVRRHVGPAGALRLLALQLR